MCFSNTSGPHHDFFHGFPHPASERASGTFTLSSVGGTALATVPCSSQQVGPSGSTISTSQRPWLRGIFRWIFHVKWCEMMWNDVKNVCEDIMWRYVKWCEDVSHNEFQWGLTGFSGWNWWLWKNLKWMGGVKSMAEAMGCQEWILNGWINHWVRLNHRSCIKRQFHSCW